MTDLGCLISGCSSQTGFPNSSPVDFLYNSKGVAYWQVTELYVDDGRPSRFQWIAPGRVSFDSDPISQYITQYYVDGKAVPMSGLLSLITFTGLDEGVLQRGARTLRSAIDL